MCCHRHPMGCRMLERSHRAQPLPHHSAHPLAMVARAQAKSREVAARSQTPPPRRPPPSTWMPASPSSLRSVLSRLRYVGWEVSMFWSSLLLTYPPLLTQLHGLHLTYLPLTPLTVAAQKVRYRVRHFGRVFTFPVVSAKILIPGVVIGHLDGARSAIFQGFDGFDTRKSQKFFANLLTYPPALRAACGRPLTYLPLTLNTHPTYLS